MQDGNTAQASLRRASALAVGRNGSVAVADTGNHAIRLLSPSGSVKNPGEWVVETIAGAPNPTPHIVSGRS